MIVNINQYLSSTITPASGPGSCWCLVRYSFASLFSHGSSFSFVVLFRLPRRPTRAAATVTAAAVRRSLVVFSWSPLLSSSSPSPPPRIRLCKFAVYNLPPLRIIRRDPATRRPCCIFVMLLLELSRMLLLLLLLLLLSSFCVCVLFIFFLSDTVVNLFLLSFPLLHSRPPHISALCPLCTNE